MSFKRGPSYRLFITTENSTAAVDAHANPPSASTASTIGSNVTATASLGIGLLGNVYDIASASSILCEVKNVSGIEPTWGWEDDPFTVFGQSRPLDNPIRKAWSITFTKKGENALFGRLANAARFGVTGSGVAAAVFDGLDTMPDTTGYRVYLYDGAEFYVGFHGTIAPDGYKETLSPTGVTEQAITIKGGIWSASIANSGSVLTSSMAIVE